jgi:hypothetical protein
MGFLNKGAAVGIGCLILALLFLAPPLTRGDEWNLTTRFTVNHPVEVPGMVLQENTPYVIRLMDSPSNRNIVQIYNDDQTQMLTMFMAISAQRTEPVDETTFTFIETNPGFPLPIKQWFYPGRSSGLEFIYPKDQAMEIARHAQEPVLAAEVGDLTHLNTITVESIGPIGTQPRAVESAANLPQPENTTVVEEKPSVAQTTPAEPSVEQEQQQQTEPENQVAENTQQPEVQQQNPVEEPAAPATQEPQELPRTAGELPFIGLVGLLCLGAGLGMKVLSAKM